MQAVILVGGQGTRLRPLTLTTPKPLVPLANRPVIEHIVRWLERAGATEIFLATQYGAGAFDRWLSGWRGLPIRAVEEPEPRGTAGAVANLATALRGTVAVVNGDNIVDLDLGAMLRAHQAAAAIATIATDSVDDPTGRGVVVTAPDSRVTEFQEKPAPGAARARTVNTGVYLLEPAAVAAIPTGIFCNFEQQVFPALIAATAGVHAFESAHIWIDTGTPAGYLRAQAAVLGGLASAPAGMLRAPSNVWLDDSVTLDASAELTGGVALGFGTAIAANVRIDGSSVGRECHILPDVRIDGSAVWDGCMVERGAAIAGSIVGYGCYVGAGARIDGAMIGDGCVIPAGTHVPPGAMVQPHQTYRA